MDYAARLARLEKLAGKGACPMCRLLRRHTWLDARKPRPKPKDPSLLVTQVCELCGAASNHDLSHYPEELRDLARLYCTSKPDDTFTDPRAWAAQRWMIYRVRAEQSQREALSETKKLSAPGQPAHERQQQDYARRQRAREREEARAKDPDVKLYNRLFAEAQGHNARRLKRLKRQYGEHPFPDLEARIGAVEAPNYDALYKGEPYAHAVPFLPIHELKQEAKSWLACAELEKIVLDKVTAHTEGRLADCERRAREVIGAARAKHEEREEKRRAEEAERERQRLERSAPAPRPTAPRPAPTPPRPQSPRPVDRRLEEEERISTPLNTVILPLD
jgi:hypothetical protein